MAESIPLSLYVHLPWCVRKCPYCDFNSHETTTIPEAAYVEALRRDLNADLMLAGRRPFGSVFFGGGTPSLFSADAIGVLLEELRQRDLLEQQAEITLEANPGTAEQARFAGYLAAGVNRLSIGVQSFQDARLAALGRIHDAGEAIAAFRMARSAGFRRINLDLMHGLPGQSAASALADLQQALELQPEHISWYQLTIEPNTRFWSAPPVLPEEDTLADIEQRGGALLNAHGYQRYEISAWCRAGEASRHNLNYWTYGDYLGIGAGAHGKLTLANGTIIRTRKTRKPADYLAADFECQQLHEQVDAERRPLEFLMNHFRLSRPFAAELFEQRTGLSLDCISDGIGKARELDLLDQDLLRPTELGHRYLNDLLALFD